MRFGCCTSVDQAAACRDAGFDFIEVNVQAVLKGTESDEAWAASAPKVDKLALPMEAANCLVPGSMPIVGDQRDLPALTAYMKRVGQRAAQLGITRLVFGSGGARKRPDGYNIATTERQLAEFAAVAADACHRHGVTVVIEHLNQRETNTLNSLADALKLCRNVNHPGLKMLVDSYHFGLEKETDAALLALGDTLAHVHVAEPIDRIEPHGHTRAGQPGKSFDFTAFFQTLGQIGYDQRISFEGKWSGLFEQVAPATVAWLRQTWEQAH